MPEGLRQQQRRVSPGTAAGIVVVVLLAVAGVSVFSLLDLAGPFGRLWQPVLATFFGSGAWLFPILLTVLAGLRVQRTRRRRPVAIGVTVAVLATLALLDLSLVPLDGAPGQSVGGAGGGYVGLFLRFPLETVFGYWVSWLLLALSFVAAALLTFDTTIEALVQPLARTLRRLGSGALAFSQGFARGLSERAARRRSDVPVPTFSTRPVALPTPAPSAEEPDAAAPQRLPLPEPARRAGASPTLSRYRAVTIDLPLGLLEAGNSEPTSGDIRAGKLLIRKTLESFGIPVEMGEVNVGPTVTQYTLKPEDGVKLAAITALANDLALALAAHPIRIEAPIPGRSLVGIEVPNQAVATVRLRAILESEAFQKRRSSLTLALGADVAGNPWVVDLERMPHLLVAGATGSGKSVALNAIIVSLLYQNSPDTLKLVLVDPKRVEFPTYQHIPHLLTPVITEVPATVHALQWLIREMDRRFTVLAEVGERNIQSYNQRAGERLPYIVVIIDELADLMVAAASEVEGAIIRLAQMARAVGIHLVLATQRPSVDVITGLIKANITARLAFSVASLMDSRTILDTGGAEKLVGRGDMLYISAEVTKPKRLQGAFVTDEEIARVVSYLKARAAPEYITEVTVKQPGPSWSGDGGDDPLLGEAEAVVVQAGKGSASLLQRRLKVGYARAARLLDLLEARGVIGPGEGAKPREVLLGSSPRGTLGADDDDGDDRDER
jgi:S-DNA-T family DNA segregation ATPase FtsK/SpoIIIE